MTDNNDVEVIISCPNCGNEIGYDDKCPCGFDDEFNGREKA
jgi:hypothetical protein